MNEELEIKLYKEDPDFFEEALKCLSGEMNECNSCMAFGCECGDGWFKPLLKLTRKMFLINSLAKKYNLKVICNQLKEKFGELRCYYSVQNTLIHDTNNPYIEIIKEMAQEAVRTCETDCWNVCEWCGADGGYNCENLITTSGWISRICKNCGKEYYFKKQKSNDKHLNIENEKRIDTFTSVYSFLNPFYKSSFKYNKNRYSSVMHAFYCMKDPEHEYIYNLLSVGDWDYKSFDIKKVAEKYFNIKIEETDYQLLKDITYARFNYEYNTKEKQLLLETNDLKISNCGYHHDNILGICWCTDCKEKEQLDLYGKILMEVRSELIK